MNAIDLLREIVDELQGMDPQALPVRLLELQAEAEVLLANDEADRREKIGERSS